METDDHDSSRLIRFVFFDLVGTLVHPQLPVAEVYERIGREFGSSLRRDEIQTRFGRAMSAADWSNANHIAQRATWRGIVYDVFEPAAAREELFESLWDYFSAPGAWRLYNDAMPAIDAVRQRGMFVAIASNFDDRVQSICKALGLTSTVDRLFWSASLNHAKPSQLFFSAIEDAIGARAHEVLMVGDSLANDIVAARAAGWSAVRIDRRDTLVSVADVISDLRDVIGFV